MLERFSEEARQAVVLAQEEARSLGHNYIGTEHILLGVLREGGIATAVLASSGVTFDGVRGEVVRIVGSGRITSGQIPFTAHAKAVLQLALEDALRMNYNHIRTEHLLLGLVVVEQGVASRVLRDAGIDYRGVRAALLHLVPLRGGMPGTPGDQRERMGMAIGDALNVLMRADLAAHDYYAMCPREPGAGPVLTNVVAAYRHIRQAAEALGDEPTPPVA